MTDTTSTKIMSSTILLNLYVPFKLDFNINALGTLNILEALKIYNKNAIFIFLSTNKVYGDYVNNFNYKEEKLRFEILGKFKNGFNA